PPVDAEEDRPVALSLPPVAPDQAEGVEIDLPRVGVSRRDRTAFDRAAHAHDRLTDREQLPFPGVLLMRLAAAELEQHPEAPRIDLSLGLPRQPGKRAVRDERHRLVEPLADSVCADEPDRVPRKLRERSVPR